MHGIPKIKCGVERCRSKLPVCKHKSRIIADCSDCVATIIANAPRAALVLQPAPETSGVLTPAASPVQMVRSDSAVSVPRINTTLPASVLPKLPSPAPSRMNSLDTDSYQSAFHRHTPQDPHPEPLTPLDEIGPRRTTLRRMSSARSHPYRFE
ncbi:hypothetical protein HDU91_006328 [Kappamyces sp. JEL0680]|nr:hypothetical protein HDU91_006328 [Kappamyces sp. JEL0680]